MAELATIARPYAAALFRAAPAPRRANWSVWLNALARLVRHPEVRRLASNPNVDPVQVSALLLTAVEPPQPEQAQQAKQFVHLLLDRRRLDALPEIARQFEALKDASEGAAAARIVSAFPLDDEACTALVKSLERKFGRKLKPQVSVEPALIGGVCVTVGDQVFDASVRAQLARMRAALTA